MAEAVKKIDVEAIMSSIRAKAKAELGSGRDKVAYYKSPPSQTEEGVPTPLLYTDELNYLNANWHNWSAPAEISSHRPIIGPIIVRIKRFLVRVIWNSVLKEYFERERQFQMQLVRFLNETARYVEKRDADIFWQLVSKIDNEVTSLNERVDRLFDEATATVRSSELSTGERLSRLEGDKRTLLEMAERTHHELVKLDELMRGVERTVASASRSQVSSSSQPIPSSSDQLHDAKTSSDGLSYLLFENRFRGSEEEIRKRLEDYLPHFRGAALPVLEIGPGRGEFLSALRDQGIPACGIDINGAMVARSRELGFDVQQGDVLDYLRGSKDGTFGGIFAAQVVEHLRLDSLEELCRLISTKVAPGGTVIFETINPQSLSALGRNFFRDPSHIWPLHPDTLRFIMETNGIKTEGIELRSPFPSEAILQPLELSEYLPVRLRSSFESINDNVERLNNLLFGFQDYCIIGRVP